MRTRNGGTSTKVRSTSAFETHADSPVLSGATRYTNPIKAKFRQRKLAAESMSPCRTLDPTYANSSDLVDGAGAAPVSRRPNVQMPDEYLPPNKILFLQNLPENVTKDQLMALFAQYVTPRLT